MLISPVHNYNITAWTKAFIDRLCCFYEFEETLPRQWSSNLAGQGRKGVIAAIAEQESMHDMGFALEAMRFPLEAMGYEIVSEILVLRIFDRSGIKSHPDTLEGAKLSSRLLVKAIVKFE